MTCGSARRPPGSVREVDPKTDLSSLPALAIRLPEAQEEFSKAELEAVERWLQKRLDETDTRGQEVRGNLLWTELALVVDAIKELS